jgi:serine/threonine protein kinase
MPNETTVLVGSPEEFLRNLTALGLNIPPPMEGAGDAAALARQLVDGGILTSYQADALLAGRLADLKMGNYDILAKLGAGGMGAVYKARHRRMKRVVALKVLSKAMAESESFVRRFQREVEVIARLAHPNVVMAYDADEAEAGPFLVMEFVDGRDLASDVADGGPLSVADAVECTIQAARGLGCAHAQGIVHRDVKPANLMRAVDGTVKVADLGLARLNVDGASVPNSSLTQAGGVVGTLDYIAPEQAVDSTAIDARVDIYSLGCTLFYLLAGRPPYSGTSLMAMLLAHRESPIPDLRAARPDVPVELEAVFRRMVAKAAADRYPAMTDLIAALEALQRAGRLSGERPSRQPAAAGSDTGLDRQTMEFGPGSDRGPLAATRVVPGPSPAASSSVAGLKVVVVEPSRMQAGITRRFLQQLSVGAVQTAGTGREAIDVVKRERADAVVCALHVSDMTGVELATALFAEPGLERLGFILTTSDEADAGGLPKTPRAVILHKPFDQTKLSAALATATGRNQ